MLLEEIIIHIGEYGRWQKRTSMLLCLVVVLVAVHILAPVFLSAETDHWCSPPAPSDIDFDYNCTSIGIVDTRECVDFIKNLTIPSTIENGEVVYEQCERYDLGDVDFSDVDFIGTTGWPNVTKKQRCEEGWEYDRSQYKSTTAQDVSTLLKIFSVNLLKLYCKFPYFSLK